jgi:hypothetical protein
MNGVSVKFPSRPRLLPIIELGLTEESQLRQERISPGQGMAQDGAEFGDLPLRHLGRQDRL